MPNSIKKFINHQRYKYMLRLRNLDFDYNIREKLGKGLLVLLTGIILKLTVQLWDTKWNFISYGLATVIIPYYLTVIVNILKKPYKE